MTWDANLTDPELGQITIPNCTDALPSKGQYVWIDVVDDSRRYYLIDRVVDGVVHASLAATGPEQT